MSRQTNFSADLILVCNSLDAGGIERVVSTLANEWSRRGRKVSVVMLHDRRRFFALDPAVHHVVIDRVGLTWIAEGLKKLKSRIAEFRVARPWLIALFGWPLYHLFAEHFYSLNFRLFIEYESWVLRRALRRIESPVVVSFGTSINIITLRACEGMGRRVIISERNDPRRLVRFGLWDLMWRKHYRSADLVTANTRGALLDMGDYVEPEKLAFVPNPLVFENGNGRARPSSTPFFLTVGRLVRDKAHDVLLDAFALLGEEMAEWRLAVVGDGRMREALKSQATNLGIAKRIDWHGIVQEPHVLYGSASIFAMPSRVEGMPNALLEAMSCGLPVVVSDGAPGPLELVEDEVTGLVVPVNDAVALAAALRRLADDPSLCYRLGKAARERVAEYELPQAMAQWESVIGLPTMATEAV
ncbi:MAG: glycosyltransferase [Pyrinomonadaceae bacterium]|nr:glycosyltransferase [Pyrinomonadaceae bacterium]